MTIPAINRVEPHSPGSVKRSYYRVDRANILVYEPAVLDEATAHIIVASMHGGLNPSLESQFLERVAAHGVRTAFCVPDKSSFIDQFRAMDACMTLLRELASSIVLMGQSRGAALMSGYQTIAENGAEVFQGPERRLPIPDMELAPADGLMLLDANFGTTIMHVMSLNPALITEGSATRIDPALDARNPANGYAPEGRARYSEDFKARFLGAQRARYNALLDTAQERWAAIQGGDGTYSDNEPFIVPDGIGINNSPKLFAGDLRLLSRTKDAWPHIHPDGSITTEIVPCVRTDENNPRFAGTMGAAFVSTVKDYLWTEVTVGDEYDYGEDYLTGVAFESSMTSSTGNVAAISCPLLLMGHTGGYEFIAAEWSFHRALSADKTIGFLEGATHGWTPIDAEKYGDTLDLEARYVNQWLAAPGRFPLREASEIPDFEVRGQEAAGGPVQIPSTLVGQWAGDDAHAVFTEQGGCELSFAAELGRFDVRNEDALHFHDRYGATVVFRRIRDAARARTDAGTFYVSDDELVLNGIQLHRAGAKAEAADD